VERALPERVGLDEGLLVADDVRALDGGEDADLVEGVLLLLLRQVRHLHLLQGVGLGVGDALHLVDRGIGALPQLRQDHEVLQRHNKIKKQPPSMMMEV